ncbi:MAG: trans-sulfuration enzyme family protein [Candidatus Promineifilaceae bacterium]
MKEGRKPSRGLNTELIHAAEEQNPSSGLASAIYQSATFRFEEPEVIAQAMAAEAHPQFYGRYGTPNTKQVEATVAHLEGAEAALAVASGMAAVSLVLLTLLRQGDHVVAQHTLYPTTTKLLSKKLPELGIACTLVDQDDLSQFREAIQPNTRLIYMESPANPTLALTDLQAVADLVRDRNILTVADNTFATPYNQRPLALGVDLVLHSATKYLGGHSDVVAGVVAGSEAQISRLWHSHVMLGAILHPFEAWLLQRGLKTFAMRMARHNENGLAVARFLASHPAVERVHYPGLEEHPQHDLAKKQMSGGFGGMVCFELREGREAGYRLLKRVQLVTQAVSLGSVHSLITHPASTISIVQSEAAVAASGVRPGLVRLSVGVEDAEDIIADLAQALA